MTGPDPEQPPAELCRNLAANFRRLRKARGETQMQLAQRTGLSQKFVSDIEVGRANPTLHTLKELAAHLGVTVADLIAPPNPKP